MINKVRGNEYLWVIGHAGEITYFLMNYNLIITELDQPQILVLSFILLTVLGEHFYFWL